jgi:hypothetical protein
VGWSEPSATPSLTNCVEYGTYNATDAHLALGWKNSGSNPSVISGVQDIYYASALEQNTGATRLYPLTSGMTTAPFVLTVTPEAADDNTAFPLGGYVGTINNNYYLGEKQDAQFYVKQGHNASFFLSYAEPYLVKDVKVNDVAATILNADTHQYTYTQGNAASVVTGIFDPPLDGKGSEEDPWVITSEQDFYKMKDFREAQIPMYRKFFKVVTLKSLDHMDRMIKVCKIVRQTTGHHVIVIDQVLDRFDSADLFPVVVQSEEGNETEILIIDGSGIVLPIDDMWSWIDLLRFVTDQFSIRSHHIEGGLLFVPHLNSLDGLIGLCDPVHIPIDDISASIVRFFFPDLHHIQTVSVFKVQTIIFTLECVHV